MEISFTVAALDGDRDCAQFTEAGMVGVERKNPKRPVSLMTLAARQGVDQAELRGLCYARFTADITLDCDQLPDTGTIIGTDDLQLGILPERKRCWPECELFQNKLPCPLIEGVRYAWVEAPGGLCLGDQLEDVGHRTDETADV
ncbi:MAG: hypothetical protein K0B06_13090 [Brevefilum sp.]|nr:hypothetical protein [Brevefilum sp.]